jgi:outer membrane protein assembly factor BamE (lipoprotein component of BamABCDE complex)
MKKFLSIATAAALALSLQGCQSVGEHRADIRDDTADKITVGTVQQKIKNGMSSADVIFALGSPNIISTDSENREVWVYDKISTENAYSGSRGGLGGLGGIVGSSGGLGAFGSYGKSTGATSTSQRTLTIVIKFDENKKVRDLAYRTSSF